MSGLQKDNGPSFPELQFVVDEMISLELLNLTYQGIKSLYKRSTLSMYLRIEKPSSIHFRPFFPSWFLRLASSANMMIAFSKAAISRGGTRRPVCWSSTTSGAPPLLQAMTGLAHAIA